MSAWMTHEEIIDLLAAADTGALELVAHVDELIDAHRDDAVVMADLARVNPDLTEGP